MFQQNLRKASTKPGANMDLTFEIKTGTQTTQTQLITDRFLEESYIFEYLKPSECDNDRKIVTKESYNFAKTLALRDFLQDRLHDDPNNQMVREYLSKISSLFVIAPGERIFTEGEDFHRFVTFSLTENVDNNMSSKKYLPSNISISLLPEEIVKYVTPTSYKTVKLVSSEETSLVSDDFSIKIFELHEFLLEKIKENNYFQPEYMSLYNFKDGDLFFSPTSTGAHIYHSNYLVRFDDLLRQFNEQSTDSLQFEFLKRECKIDEGLLDLDLLKKYEKVNIFLSELKQEQLRILLDILVIPPFELPSELVLEIGNERKKRKETINCLMKERQKLQNKLKSKERKNAKASSDQLLEDIENLNQSIFQKNRELKDILPLYHFTSETSKIIKNLSLKFTRNLRHHLLEGEHHLEELKTLIEDQEKEKKEK